MRCAEEVIVTVNISDPASSYDMEIPSFLSIGELKKKLLETLRLMDARKYAGFNNIELFFHGRRLDDGATPAQYGIWDGSIVTVKQGNVS